MHLLIGEKNVLQKKLQNLFVRLQLMDGHRTLRGKVKDDIRLMLPTLRRSIVLYVIYNRLIRCFCRVKDKR